MLNLREVTLVCVATTNIKASLKAMQFSMKSVSFNQCLFFTNSEIICPNGIKKIRINSFNSVDEWSFFIVFDLYKYIQTKHIILIHYDGYIVNPESWKEEFLEYDYIGAPWPEVNDGVTYKDDLGNDVRVGNSVSLRSKKILELPSVLSLKWEPFHGFLNEDGFLCCKNKRILESNGIRFADIDIAKYFSHEYMIPEIEGIKPFMFHKFFGKNKIYKNFIPTYLRIFKRLKKLI